MDKTSWMDAFLVVDLSAGRFRTVPVPGWLKRDFVGGKGFGARLLYDLAGPGIDPLGPDNPLMFLTGPLTGTSAPSMRACVVCKSPLTGGYLDSFFGGHFGPEIKFAGYDGIIIHGCSREPVYLAIRDGEVEFRDGRHLSGLDALETAVRIKTEMGDPLCRTVTIGPAGENRVGFALITCDYNRQAGRGGAGAVMGAKGLKGIAVKGSRLVRVHDPRGFRDAVSRAMAEIGDSAACRALTDSGTSYAVPWSSEVGTLPVRNFRQQQDPGAGKIGDGGQKKHLFLGKAACFACPIRCAQMGAVRTGRYAHLVTDTVEYESAAMLGSNLDIHDVRALAHLTRLCDSLGVDSISMGNVIGFAFEACEKGLVRPPEGISLAFGSVDGAEYLIRSVAFGEDGLGRLLGQGVKRAAQELGQGSGEFALHVKGMEIPGWAPRGTPGMGLAYMTADRGACHQRGFMVAYEAGGEPYDGKPVSRYGTEGKAAILKGEQDYLSGTDALVKCDFAAFGISRETFGEMYRTATGMDVDRAFLPVLGERIWNLVRLFNLREGFGRKDDRLPPRIVNEALAEGPHKGQRIDEAMMEAMLTEYYRVRGWGPDGIPAPETLERLGLDSGGRLDAGDFSGRR